MATLRWWWAYLRLVLRAGVTWGLPFTSDYEETMGPIREHPVLHVEAARVDQLRARV